MQTAAVFTLLAAVAVAGQQMTRGSLDSLARDVERVESIREVKDLQRTFSHLAQFGDWGEMSSLFSDAGVLQWGNQTASGPRAIEAWLAADAGAMDGIRPGSLDTVLAENPLVSLAADGLSAKARWNGQRFQGDGAGATRIQGGIYENEYVLTPSGWRISLLHYYPYYEGNYTAGWRNVGGLLPLVPYHFTPASAGVPIPAPPAGETPPPTEATAAQLAARIEALGDEDEVRNLQHSLGYYVDRRMWTDVLELFVANGSSVTIDGVGSFAGPAAIRQVLERRMGPEELSWGVLNDRVLFSTVVKVDAGGEGAWARGTEVGMLGDVGNNTASWEFSVFRNRFAKGSDGRWRLQELHITPIVAADYRRGWGDGGLLPVNRIVPEFLGLAPRRRSRAGDAPSSSSSSPTASDSEMRRRLARAAAFDGTENLSSAYGFYLDDLRCGELGAIHAARAHKLTPFTGWFQGVDKIAGICRSNYGDDANPMRASIAFHWRPQPVVVASRDGRSASCRSRLLQPSTSVSSPGSFNGAVYHDQMVLDRDGVWRLWSITIDEFYWQSGGWANGWALGRNATRPPAVAAGAALSSLLGKRQRQRPVPDVSLLDVGEREATFRGGAGPVLNWPEIQRMWFAYRNPVSGRAPRWYWPGCVPCRARPDWALEANGFQEPPTGPTLVDATVAAAGTVAVAVAGGPDEPVVGEVALWEGETRLATAALGNGTGVATLALPSGLPPGPHTLTAAFAGSDRLAPGKTIVTFVV